ncbi:MAG: flagellar biosynthesis protein FlhB [Thermodesulfobacteriota bacterium]|nr:flagellar biosynthesis protein FlhB [Thermodesulfobacteriota bacterium]
MAEESFQEKTEKATPRRREEARKKGQVARSREVSAVLVVLTGFITLYACHTYVYHSIRGMMVYFLRQAADVEINRATIGALGFTAVQYLGLIAGPILLTVFLMAFLANYLQVGFVFSTENLQPKLSKINPWSGLKRIFSIQAVAELFKSIAKIAIVGYMAYRTVKGEMPRVLPLMDAEIGQILGYVSMVSFKIFLNTCLVMLLLAALDYAFQRWEFERKIRMTKQEIKEEFKQTEGDPLIKSRIRSIQREMARRRMMAAVPKADVVITNPTHLAVALQYRVGESDAPEVVAKGAGLIAEKIKEIAMENNVPLVEDKPLAQILYKTVEIGQMIPPNLYQAVAEILAYVYRLKNKAFAAG